MKYTILLLLISTCFAMPLITVDREGMATMEVDEPFEKTFEFTVLGGNFTMEGTTVVPSPHLTIQTESLTSKNGTEWSMRVPFRATVFLPQPVSITSTPNIEKVSFSIDKVSVLVSPGELVYSFEMRDASSIPVTTVLVALAFLLALSILLLLYFFLREGKQQLKQPFEQPLHPNEGLLRLLTENEKALYTRIAERPGITQKELFAISGLPKSTLSITLKRLVSKGLVESAKVGISVKLYPTKRQ